MKNFTLLLAAAAVAALSLQPSDASAKSLIRPVKKARVTATADSPKALPTSRVLPRAAGDVWKPGKTAEYIWIIDDAAWNLYTENQYEYYDNSLVKSVVRKETWETRKVGYEYDEYRYITCITNSYLDEATQQFTLSDRLIYEYDPIIHWASVKSFNEGWSDNQWQYFGGYSFINITRDTAGNITKVEPGYAYGDDEQTNYRCIIEYGADGKASKIIVEEKDYSGEIGAGFATECVISDIVWANTNGQILLFSDTPTYDGEDYYNLESEYPLFVGANRIASCTMVSEDYGNVKLNLTVDYSSATFHVVGKTDAGKTYIDWEYNDLSGIDGHGPGSYESKQFEIDLDYDEDTNTHYEVEMLEYEKYYTDAYGLMLLDEEIQYEDDELDDYYKEIGTVEYDSTYGYPLTYVVTEEEDGEMAPEYKVLYSDYKQYSGIADVAVDSENAPVEYFNLQGVKMDSDNLAPGLYIRRQGAKAQKVLVK